MADKAHFFNFGPVLSGISPMSGFQLYHYDPGTTNAKTVWSDYEKSATASQPFQADVRGVVNFFGDGLYRLLGVDANSVTLYDIDNVQIGPLPQGIPISVHKNGTNQVSVTTGTWVKVTWSTETFDEAGTFASDRWTPGRIGRALVHGRGTFVSGVNGNTLYTSIYLNSALINEAEIALGATAASLLGASVTAIIDITAITDFVEMYVRQDNGADLILEGDSSKTYFMGAMIA